MIPKLSTIIKIWDTVEVYFAGIVLCAAVGIYFLQVVLRYLFHASTYWAEELVIYSVIWGVFVVSSKLVRDDQHVSIDFIRNAMPAKFQKVINIACCFLALSFSCFLALYGFKMVAAGIALDERSVTRLAFPMWIVYLAVPIGGCLIGLSYLLRLYFLIRNFPKEGALTTKKG